ncbi:MAG: hypothetical protein ACRD01_08645 [Terriglobales bacterium]
MSLRNGVAKVLVALASLVLLACAGLHLLGAEPRLWTALQSSNLSAPLPSALRAVFVMVGWDWIVLAAIAWVAVRSATRVRRPILLVCGVGLAVQTLLTLHWIGWFIGSDLVLAATVLMLAGGWVCPGQTNAPNAESAVSR